MVSADIAGTVRKRVRRKWSFTGSRVSRPKVALQAFLTVGGVLLLFLLLFRPQKAAEKVQGDNTSGVFRLPGRDPLLRRRFDLRDPAAPLRPDSPAGYLALRPPREQDFFIVRPRPDTAVAAAPRPKPFARLPEQEELPPSFFAGGNVSSALTPRLQKEGKIFSEEGTFLGSLPLPASETEAPAGQTVLKISGTGPLRQVVPVFSCGSTARDRAAQSLLETRRLPDGLYLVIWPETRKETPGS